MLTSKVLIGVGDNIKSCTMHLTFIGVHDPARPYRTSQIKVTSTERLPSRSSLVLSRILLVSRLFKDRISGLRPCIVT